MYLFAEPVLPILPEELGREHERRHSVGFIHASFLFHRLAVRRIIPAATVFQVNPKVSQREIRIPDSRSPRVHHRHGLLVIEWNRVAGKRCGNLDLAPAAIRRVAAFWCMRGIGRHGFVCPGEYLFVSAKENQHEPAEFGASLRRRKCGGGSFDHAPNKDRFGLECSVGGATAHGLSGRERTGLGLVDHPRRPVLGQVLRDVANLELLQEGELLGRRRQFATALRIQTITSINATHLCHAEVFAALLQYRDREMVVADSAANRLEELHVVFHAVFNGKCFDCHVDCTSFQLLGLENPTNEADIGHDARGRRQHLNLEATASGSDLLDSRFMSACV